MKREEEAFAELLALPAAERGAFLEQVGGGEPALRVRLEALLAGHAAAEQRLPGPLVVRPAAAPDESPGDWLGRYKLLERIGEGGWGVVWLAEQEEPVRRRVALKVIKLGMDTRVVIARFEAERQTLALMDHPNIAKVFDAGSTAGGRPFFVMELVHGVPITRFCDEHNLALRERLQLFITVCHAIQHAHQKGIIHRDIKPSNVLVTMHDDAAVPVVIDFGIAKATQGRLTNQTVFTALEQFVGTPAYMSPEQTEFHAVDIDTRADLYSLGVLLYELLTGHTPFDPRELGQAGLDEIRRIIREVDPPRPSTRLGTMQGDVLSTLAHLRRTEAPRLVGLVRGDLDWIVMRCLEKDRARRYPTANSLADDLARHLRNEPVSARPPSAVYRLRKFSARHRIALVSAGAVTAVLVMGVLVAAGQAVRAIRAEREQSRLRQAAEQAQVDERIQRTRAEVSEKQAQTTEQLTAEARGRAEDVLEFMLRDLPTRLDEVGQLALVHATVQKALDYYDRLPAELRDGSSVAGYGLALALHAAVRGAYGETDVARQEYQRAREVFEAAERRGPLAPGARLAYAETLLFSAGTHAADGRSAEAMAFRVRAIPLLESVRDDPRYGAEARWRLADALQARALSLGGNPQTRRQALELFEQALAMARAHARERSPASSHPDIQTSQITYYTARTWWALGEQDRARALLGEARSDIDQVRARQPGLTSVLSTFGQIAGFQQQIAWQDWDEIAAAAILAEYVAAARELARLQPDRWTSRRNLAAVSGDEWTFRAANGDWARVRELIREALSHFKECEDNAQMRGFHASTLERAAQHYFAMGLDAEAAVCLETARREWQVILRATTPPVGDPALFEANLQNLQRKALLARFQPEAAEHDALALLARIDDLPSASRDSAAGVAVRRGALLDASWAAFLRGDYRAAADRLREAGGGKSPAWEPPKWRNRLARAEAAHEALAWAQVLARAGRRDEAQAIFVPARREAEELHAERPDLFIAQRLLAHSQWACLDIDSGLSRPERRAVLERLSEFLRAGIREHRLTRFEREFCLPDIERQRATLPPAGAG